MDGFGKKKNVTYGVRSIYLHHFQHAGESDLFFKSKMTVHNSQHSAPGYLKDIRWGLSFQTSHTCQQRLL